MFFLQAVNPQQQFDLNVASLKTLVRLFEKLEIKPLDNSGDDPFIFVMRLLGRYHLACFKLLEFTGVRMRCLSWFLGYSVSLSLRKICARTLLRAAM